MKMQMAQHNPESTENSRNIHASNGDSCDQIMTDRRNWECGKTTGVATGTQIFNEQQKDLVRLLVQSLRDMGYSNSAKMLENESGFCLESSSVVKFRQGILSGNWTAVENLLPMMELHNNVDIQTVKFLIRQQKYLELLEARNIKNALHVLQQELTPLGIHPERLHKLSSFMMCSNVDDFRAKAEWDGPAGSTRQRLLVELQKCISPSVMVPPHRLETLMSQATTYQRTKCLYHNDIHDNISLFQDHVCDRSQFPCTTMFTLDAHLDEVWYVVFSNFGRHVASASKDKSAIIWSLETMKPLHTLNGHTEPVSFVVWSADDTYLLTCGNDHALKLWNTNTGCLMQTFKKHTEPVTSCAWLPSGIEFVSGGMDKSVYLWNIDGTVIHKWTGGRVTDLTINKEGTRMVSICSEKKIRVYDMITKTEAFFVQETDNLTSVSLSNDSRFALINVASQELHLWNLDERILVQKYVGQKQGRFVIRSDFGGTNQTFIVSGSEDNFIYVWQREQATLIEALPGHSGTVNSVSWNPTDPYMFASASDDCTIRIWGVPGYHGDKGKQAG